MLSILLRNQYGAMIFVIDGARLTGVNFIRNWFSKTMGDILNIDELTFVSAVGLQSIAVKKDNYE